MLLVDPGISLIGSGDCPGQRKGNAPAARPANQGADGQGNSYLIALYLLNKRYPKEVPPITAQDLQCMRADPQSGSDPQKLGPLRLCPGRDWDLGTMWNDGIARTGLCKAHHGRGRVYHDCAEKNYGTAVITAIPQMSAYCYEGPDYNMDDVAKCAGRKFKKAWYDKIFNNIPADDACAVIPPPPPPTWTTPGAASCKTTRPSLRRRLRDSLCKNNPDSCSQADDADAAAPNDQPQQQQATAPPEPPPQPKENQAWCNYVADAHRRGDLLGVPIPEECPREKAAYDKPPDLPQFTMSPVDTDREVKGLEDDWCNQADNHCPWRPAPTPQPVEGK